MTSSSTHAARFQLDVVGYQLLNDGRPVRIERQPMELLILLVKRRDELVTRDEIAALFWGQDVFVDADQSINRIVRKLRVALNDDPDHARFLETVVGKGYRFIGPIDAVSRSTSGGSLHATAAAQPSLSGVTRRSPFHTRHLVATVAAVSLLLALGAFMLRRQLGANPSGPSIRTLAVLPLQNLSGDPSQDYLADGMTDEITTDLAKIGTLTVISRTSAVRYRGASQSLPQIGRALNVDAVIEGSVVRAGDKVRITAQLIDVKSDRHLWAESYERDVHDLLGVQSVVALEIARQVRAKLTSAEQDRLEKRRSVNTEAYDAYLRGRYLLTSQSPEAFQAAAAAFQQAIHSDATYAPAYSGLADAFSLLANYQALSPTAAFPQAEDAATRSLALDGSLAEAHASLGFAKHHYDWDWSRRAGVPNRHSTQSEQFDCAPAICRVAVDDGPAR